MFAAWLTDLRNTEATETGVQTRQGPEFNRSAIQPMKYEIESLSLMISMYLLVDERRTFKLVLDLEPFSRPNSPKSKFENLFSAKCL